MRRPAPASAKAVLAGDEHPNAAGAEQQVRRDAAGEGLIQERLDAAPLEHRPHELRLVHVDVLRHFDGRHQRILTPGPTGCR
jgi:hypothetical protein